MPSSTVLVVIEPAARAACPRRRVMREKQALTVSQMGKIDAEIQVISGTCG